MELLRAFISALHPVPEPDFALLTPHIAAKTVPKGAHLLEAGQVCGAVFFVNTGFCRMYYVGPDGHEVNCRFAGAAGFLTDYQSFLTQQPSRYYWQALQPAELLILPHSVVQRLYRESPAWERFGRLMAERVYQQLNERVELLQFYTPAQRYQYVQQHQPELLKQVSQVQLASYLGVQPESLSRIRHRLQLPVYYNYKPTARRGYAFADVAPLYPFGYGLSYSTFAIGEPKLAQAEIGPGGSTAVAVTVRNTGARPATEVVQLYIRDEVSSVTRPTKELKAFQRVTLKPGETQTVTLLITPAMLAFYNINLKYTVEPGEFTLMVGNSSRTEDLRTTTLRVR